ncbi:acetylxylan esterase [Actinocrinis puniceicyclus]|uniref:Acetylxylan esterase n=1 Tax=Actinocrinis puniceicyclus TaxID=977794 RepID=A0A8J7WGV2_9ACTN|nr:acetylxylan esterase [Actinocrinis puniceicyclus]MBS2961933.1 acetylxylan esterase [Actinocrinis puniceicyclus]
MAFIDKDLDELVGYLPARTEPGDFAAFWSDTLAAARSHPLDAAFTALESPLTTVVVEDATFRGYGGQPIKGWMLRPAAATGPLPAIVEYVGYGGGRGLHFERLLWASAGYAHFVMDTRGQGAGWSVGETPDDFADGNGPAYPGVMTRGILAPETYYYRRLYTDAVRAVEAARSHPHVDGSRIVVHGGSQGGGLALAVAGLVGDLAGVLADVPFLQHLRHATEITDGFPYKEIANFCKVHRDKTEQVFRTLSYFDGLNFAVRAGAPALYSVALMDEICPPSTVFASYNHYAGPKEITVYPYNGHEGGQAHQVPAALSFAAAVTK